MCNKYKTNLLFMYILFMLCNVILPIYYLKFQTYFELNFYNQYRKENTVVSIVFYKEFN